MTKKRINFTKVIQVKESAGLYDLGTGKVNSPGDAIRILDTLFPDLRDSAEENLVMLTLNTKNIVVGAHTVSKGSVSASVLHPREVMKLAILNNASSFVLAHNHPSGDTTPSREDVDVTRRMYEVGELMGISLLDHIILGDGYTSLNQEGKF